MYMYDYVTMYLSATTQVGKTCLHKYYHGTGGETCLHIDNTNMAQVGKHVYIYTYNHGTAWENMSTYIYMYCHVTGWENMTTYLYMYCHVTGWEKNVYIY
jgi:hypothetical protein